jgi:AraC-like DNA-binding protein
MLFPERPVQVIHEVWEKPRPRSFDMHLGLELGIVLRGRMTRHYPGGVSTHGPGEMWFHDVWESHGWEVCAAPTEAVILIIHPRTLEQMRFPEVPGFGFTAPFSLPPLRRPRVPAARRPEILAIARELRARAAQSAPLDPLRVRVLLMRLILAASEGWRPGGAPGSAPGAAGDGAAGGEPRRAPARDIEPALRLIEAARRFLPVAEAAAACGMGARSFREAFKALMGIDFSRYALKYRVDGVALGLLQSADPVKALAADWGFTDTSHLDRSFRRFYGCFPTEYRARHRR